MKRPLRYDWSWDDSGSGGRYNGSFWLPVSPNGYSPVGFVCSGEAIDGNGHNVPTDMTLAYCVRNDLLTWTGSKWIGPLWTDEGSGARGQCSVMSWTQTPEGAAIDPGVVTSSFWNIQWTRHPNMAASGPGMIRLLRPEQAQSKAIAKATKIHATGLSQGIQAVVQTALKAHQDSLTLVTNQLHATIPSDPDKISRPAQISGNEKLIGGDTASQSIPAVTHSPSQFSATGSMLAGIGNSIGLDQLPGFNQIPLLKGVRVTDAEFTQGTIATGPEAGQPWMCLSGNVTVQTNRFGSVSGQVIALSRLYKKEGLRTGYVIKVPTTAVASKLPGLNSDPLNALHFSDAAVTFGQETHSWNVADLPVEVKTALQAYAPTGKELITFPKGENVWLVASVQSNSLLAAPFTVLNAAPAKVLFTAIFPEKPTDPFKLRATLQTKYKTTGFLPSGINLDMPDMEISTGSFNGVTLWSDLHLNLSKKLHVDLPARLDFPVGVNPLSGISVSGIIPGTWKDPMGLKGLSLSEMKISGTFGSLPNLGLAANMNLGQGWDLDLAGALSFTSPVALTGLRCDIPRDLSLGDLISLHGIIMKAAIPSAQIPSLATLKLPIDVVKITKPSFSIAEVDMPALNFRQGISFNGGLKLGTADLGSAYLWMLADKGLECTGWVSPFNVGPIKISGAGPDKRSGTPDDKPMLDLKYTPKSAFDVSQRCYLSGTASIPGVGLDAFVDIGKDNLKMNLDGMLAGVLDAQIVASGTQAVLTDVTKGGDMAFEGFLRTHAVQNIKNAVNNSIGGNSVVKKAIDFIGGGIDIRSVRVKGSLDGLSKGTLASGSVHAAAFGKAINIDFAQVSIADFNTSIASQIGARVITIAQDLITNPGAYFKALCDLSVELGGDVVKLFKMDPTQYYSQATQDIASVGIKAFDSAKQGAQFAQNTAKEAAKAAEGAAKKVEKVLSDIASGALKLLKSFF
ncbi:hypothetical protein Plut_1031 [Pelodictyon luteolum DSM 273]|uniref:Uncharacterized protein n=2 Tax=Pelodictyon luteolum TaxID=1100 RepID=Q3B438_CHLL3|nr:hypothetical protein Plut_1031 [Pelodictyon luteolum DSM 273]